MLRLMLLTAMCWLVGSSQGLQSAPKLSDKEQKELEIKVKGFVAKVVTAIGKQDIPALVDLCQVPFLYQTNGIEKKHEELASSFDRSWEGKPKFAGVHEVKKIQYYKDAKLRFKERDLKDANAIVTDDDFVVHVEVAYLDQKLQMRFFIKMAEGKPRLVGYTRERVSGE